MRWRPCRGVNVGGGHPARRAFPLVLPPRCVYDVYVVYVETASLRLGIWILMHTVARVLCRANISAEGHVTMPPFHSDRSD